MADGLRYAPPLHSPTLKSKMKQAIIAILVLLTVITILMDGCSDKAPGKKIFSFVYPSFYMKVIDQNGQPVAGAETIISHGGNWDIFGSNMGEAKYISDFEGLISIKVDFRQISFWSFLKEGYNIHLAKILFDYYKSRSFSVPAQGDLWPSDFKKFSKKSPFLVNVWRIDTNERLAKCWNGYKRQLLLHEETYGVNLLDPSKDVVIQGDLELPIQIRYKREQTNHPNLPKILSRREIFEQDWSYSIKISNGGIVECNPEDIYKKRPPQSGYKNYWILDNNSFHPRSDAYGGAGLEDDRHFYLKFDNGDYARFSVRFIPVGSTKVDLPNGIVEFDYSVNTNGSSYVRGIDYVGRYSNRILNRNNSCVDYIRLTEQTDDRHSILQGGKF